MSWADLWNRDLENLLTELEKQVFFDGNSLHHSLLITYYMCLH